MPAFALLAFIRKSFAYALLFEVGIIRLLINKTLKCDVVLKALGSFFLQWLQPLEIYFENSQTFFLVSVSVLTRHLSRGLKLEQTFKIFLITWCLVLLFNSQFVLVCNLAMFLKNSSHRLCLDHFDFKTLRNDDQ